jgi:hypothetical protein
VASSIVFISWQMRQRTYQRRMANAIAGTSGKGVCLLDLGFGD